ncbi:MAG TPA: hypothetical protein VIN10_02410 [Bacteroidales bacterium]
MKKIVHKRLSLRILCILMLLVAIHSPKLISAQDIPPPNPELDINILSGNDILFVFDEISEYKNGIMNAGQITYIRIGSITKWQLTFKADQIMFYGNVNPAHQMELNNVGVVVVSTGTNQDDGIATVNYAKASPLCLESNDVLLLNPGTGTNRGYGIKNAFSLFWEMGTKRGNMNTISMLEQNLAPDMYTVTITLTLTPVF